MRMAAWKQRTIILHHESGLTDEDLATLMGVTTLTIQRVLAGHFRRVARNETRNEYDRCPGCGGLVKRWPCLDCAARFQPIIT